MMGSIYKQKHRSCGLCKPHKVGWAPKDKPREAMTKKLLREEAKYAE